MKKILVYGYGNPGRQDDGMGVLVADEIEKWAGKQGYSNVNVETNYQLNIEDAEIISDKDFVIFVDASMEQIEDIICTKIVPDNSTIEFTMHAVSPAFIVDMCSKMFGKTPDCFLLHIKGYEWELAEGVTQKALVNYEKALAFAKKKIVEILGQI
jgi:hydrogenase maturation protease